MCLYSKDRISSAGDSNYLSFTLKVLNLLEKGMSPGSPKIYCLVDRLGEPQKLKAKR